MTDNDVEKLMECTNIDSDNKINLYIKNIAIALQSGHTILHIHDINYVPSDDDIPTIKGLIGDIDSKVLELMNDYLLKATACYNNDTPEKYGDLTAIREKACMDVADRVRVVIREIEQAEHSD